MNHARIYRFGDCVAMYLGTGQTVYLTPKDALKIAASLNQCAKDCRANKFINGTFKTAEFALTDTGHNGTDFKIKRALTQEVEK